AARRDVRRDERRGRDGRRAREGIPRCRGAPPKRPESGVPGVRQAPRLRRGLRQMPRLRLLGVLIRPTSKGPSPRARSGEPWPAMPCSTARAYTPSVAEHAMALLLAAAKDVGARTEEIRRGTFDQGVVNKALAGSTVLILGLGGIGREVARLSKAFRMHTIGM